MLPETFRHRGEQGGDGAGKQVVDKVQAASRHDGGGKGEQDGTGQAGHGDNPLLLFSTAYAPKSRNMQKML